MAVTKAMLVSELQDLLRLTSFEQTIATVRRTQAASTPVADELKANAAKSVERAQLLRQAVKDLGGVPDVVGAALSRAGAFLQTQVNQVQTLQGALLGDLALEHQLRERTRYARTLAASLGQHQVLPVLDRLETAHTATIAWLEARLDEVGRTGTSALKATPVQAAVGSLLKYGGAPFAVAAGLVNRGTSLLARGARTAGEDVIDLTGVDADQEPFAAFHTLSGDSIIRHVAEVDDLDELRETLAYERAHKDRKGVVQAVEARLAQLTASV
ncbi:MAG: hypothetical protein JWN08_1689 [Frankiales bacterium]|nr:hypothetical protein [Frankiales bacterium]